MAEPRCEICAGSAFAVEVKDASVSFYCENHTTDKEIRRINSKIYRFAVKLWRNPELNPKFWSIFSHLPANFPEFLSKEWRESHNLTRFHACSHPSDLLSRHDKDWLLWSLCTAGLRFPCEFIEESEAEKLLINMIQKNTSVSVIKRAFSQFPNGRNPIKVFSCLVKSPHSTFEKKLLFEAVFPHYFQLARKSNPQETKKLVEMVKNEEIKAIIRKFQRDLGKLLLVVVKVMEIDEVMRKLPRNVRRFVVEEFIF